MPDAGAVDLLPAQLNGDSPGPRTRRDTEYVRDHPPVLPVRALADFGALCGVGATLATESGHPVLASWTIELPRCAVAEQVRRLPAQRGRTFVWTSAWTGQRRLGAGTALDVTRSGADRFEQLSASWRHARDGALVGGTGRRPSLVGGFSFADGSPAAGWPAALMWLPAAELTEQPGAPTELTLNAWLRPGQGRDSAVRCSGEAVRILLTDSAIVEHPRTSVSSTRETPSELEWKQLVRRALAEIAAGTFDIVVPARQLAVEFDRPVAVAPVLAALIDQHRVGAVFGAQVDEQWFVGRSPECLLHLHDGRADTHGLGGSVPRDPDPAVDATLRNRLRTDATLDREHTLVTDYVVDTLRRFFRDVQTDTATPVLELADIQHRQTGIQAVRATRPIDLLGLAGALHPTPAVGGYPTAPALRWLAKNEALDRGWYAAPIGWLGADGQGELAVGIRSAVISGSSAVVYAGCGIVEGSDPDEEYDATCTKMRQMLEVLVHPL
jgi:salicylate biosynthesis isochorismate synthase